MATAIPSDHYKVLGVAPDADAAAIKTAYRKLVLKCHPDKVSDPALKEQKQDEFQQVQQSYETLSDPDKRQRYDLELRAKELREERDRTRSSRTSPAAPRTANVRVSTNPDFRSPHSSPPKMYSYKTYSGVPDYKTRDPIYVSRSKHSHEPEMRSSRSASDEKLRRDDYRDSKESRRREEESDYRRAKKEREEYERRKYEKQREREREDREAQAKAAARAEKKLKEREREREREKERRKPADDGEKARSKPRSPYVEPYYAEDVDDRKSRKTRSSPKKESTSTRDKSSSKMRDRSSAREEVPLPTPQPELPAQDNVMKSKLDFAAKYISSKSRNLPKHVPETPVYSDSYPDPNEKWTPPQRRGSGEARHSQPDPIEILEGGSPSRAEFDTSSAQAAPPRLHKTYTAPPGQMFTSTDVPMSSHAPKRATLNRAQTMDPEYPARHDRYKPARAGGRSSMEDSSHDDYYLDGSVYAHAPKVQKYTVRRGENHIPRVSESYYTESTPSPSSGPFGKIKTSQHIRPENIERTRSYGMKDAATMEYQPMFSHPNGNPTVYAEA